MRWAAQEGGDRGVEVGGAYVENCAKGAVCRGRPGDAADLGRGSEGARYAEGTQGTARWTRSQ